MSSDIIRFNCKACHAELTVPANLAGVTGPCPICGSEITAPHPEPLKPEPAFAWPPSELGQAAAASTLPARPLPHPDPTRHPHTPAPSPPEQPPWLKAGNTAAGSPRDSLFGDKQTPARNSPPGEAGAPAAGSPWPSGQNAQGVSGGFGSVSKLNETLSQQEFEPVPSKGRDLWTTVLPVMLAVLVIAAGAYYFLVIQPAGGFGARPSAPGETLPAKGSPAEPPKMKPVKKAESDPSVPADAGTRNVAPLPPNGGVPPAAVDPASAAPAPPETRPNPAVPATPGAEKPAPVVPSAGGAGANVTPPDVKIVAVSAQLPPVMPPPAALPVRVEAPPEAKPAVDVLLKFLEAPTWKERIAYTSNSPKLKAIMEKYYQQNPDEPAKAKSVIFVANGGILDKEQNVKIFSVFTESVPGGVPAVVEKNKEGKFIVSWSSFSQFKDKVLDKFASKPRPNLRGQFCAMLKRSHYFGNGTLKYKKDDFLSFRVFAPSLITNPPSYEVVVDRKSELGQQLFLMIPYNIDLPVTVDLEWVTDDGAPYLKLASMPMPGCSDE